MRVVLSHAYSRSNSGDGLLVDEAIAIVREAYPAAEISLLALDPDSFRDLGLTAVLHPLLGVSDAGSSLEAARLGIQTLVRRRLRSDVARALATADLIVAVGGGYMRAANALEAIKTLLAHYVQIPRDDVGPRTVYLPQSIGPLRFGTKALVRRRLQNVDAVFLRDDRSMAGLSGLANVRRLPDMALLGLPADFSLDDVVSEGDTVGLVARALPGSRSRVARYDRQISALIEEPGFELLAQATARGNNDPAYYASLGYPGNYRSLKDAVEVSAGTARPGAVVSVRLHGALQSIRSGVPAVHLSYERKGFGAYSDLGIDRFVHNAYDFDRETVLKQVQELLQNPTPYWNAVQGAVEELVIGRGELIQHLRNER